MPIYIVPSIIAVLVLLVSMGFLSHTLEKRRIQRQRLITALKVRERNFKYMVTGFPPLFLPYELAALAYRALVEVCEELARLDPSNNSHKADIAFYTNELAGLAKQLPQTRVKLESANQIADIRQHLHELHRCVAIQEAQHVITPIQAAALNDQIKRLILQISMDAYLIQAKQAQRIGKYRLAIHHLLLAKKLLSDENSTNQYDKQILQISQSIATLEQKASPETSEENITGEPEASPVDGNQWKHFDADDKWKKKQIYD